MYIQQKEMIKMKIHFSNNNNKYKYKTKLKLIKPREEKLIA